MMTISSILRTTGTKIPTNEGQCCCPRNLADSMISATRLVSLVPSLWREEFNLKKGCKNCSLIPQILKNTTTSGQTFAKSEVAHLIIRIELPLSNLLASLLTIGLAHLASIALSGVLKRKMNPTWLCSTTNKLTKSNLSTIPVISPKKSQSCKTIKKRCRKLRRVSLIMMLIKLRKN